MRENWELLMWNYLWGGKLFFLCTWKRLMVDGKLLYIYVYLWDIHEKREFFSTVSLQNINLCQKGRKKFCQKERSKLHIREQNWQVKSGLYIYLLCSDNSTINQVIEFWWVFNGEFMKIMMVVIEI